MSAGVEHYRMLQMKLEEIIAKNGGLESEEEDILLEEMDHAWRQLTDDEWHILNEEQ